MTTAACAYYIRMIHKVYRVPGAIAVAGIAVTAGIDMSCALAGGGGAVMA